MRSNIEIRCRPNIAKPRGIVGAEGDGQAEMVEGDGGVLRQVVDVAEELVGQWADLDAGVFGD